MRILIGLFFQIADAAFLCAEFVVYEVGNCPMAYVDGQCPLPPCNQPRRIACPNDEILNEIRLKTHSMCAISRFLSLVQDAGMHCTESGS